MAEEQDFFKCSSLTRFVSESEAVEVRKVYEARLAREAAKPEAKAEREEARSAQRAAQRAEDPEHEARLEARRAAYHLSRQAAEAVGSASWMARGAEEASWMARRAEAQAPVQEAFEALKLAKGEERSAAARVLVAAIKTFKGTRLGFTSLVGDVLRALAPRGVDFQVASHATVIARHREQGGEWPEDVSALKFSEWGADLSALEAGAAELPLALRTLFLVALPYVKKLFPALEEGIADLDAIAKEWEPLTQQWAWLNLHLRLAEGKAREGAASSTHPTWPASAEAPEEAELSRLHGLHAVARILKLFAAKARQLRALVMRDGKAVLETLVDCPDELELYLSRELATCADLKAKIDSTRQFRRAQGAPPYAFIFQLKYNMYASGTTIMDATSEVLIRASHDMETSTSMKMKYVSERIAPLFTVVPSGGGLERSVSILDTTSPTSCARLVPAFMLTASNFGEIGRDVLARMAVSDALRRKTAAQSETPISSNLNLILTSSSSPDEAKLDARATDACERTLFKVPADGYIESSRSPAAPGCLAFCLSAERVLDACWVRPAAEEAGPSTPSAAICEACFADTADPVTAACGHAFCRGCIEQHCPAGAPLTCLVCSSPPPLNAATVVTVEGVVGS